MRLLHAPATTRAVVDRTRHENQLAIDQVLRDTKLWVEAKVRSLEEKSNHA